MLGIYIFVLISIPIGAYLASQTQTINSNASEPKTAKPTPKASPLPNNTPAVKDLLSASESNVSNLQPETTPSPASYSESPTIATSFGPTLSLKTILEGRPAGNQATKLFIGIAEGTLSPNPKFLLSFSVDLPASGTYSNLSLAGLTPGTKYTALIKGSSQIAASSEFSMSPTVSTLNEGAALNMLSGDLNEDNAITEADLSIVQRAFGASSKSANWNELADLNKDNVVNAFDLAIVTKNLGQVGASGAWTSPIPKTATPSASLDSPVGAPSFEEVQGYWIWIPR